MKACLQLRVESTSGILVTGNGTDGPTFGFPDTTCNVPAIMRGGFRVTGSIGEAAGIGAKGTGFTRPRCSQTGHLAPIPRREMGRHGGRPFHEVAVLRRR